MLKKREGGEWGLGFEGEKEGRGLRYPEWHRFLRSQRNTGGKKSDGRGRALWKKILKYRMRCFPAAFSENRVDPWEPNAGTVSFKKHAPFGNVTVLWFRRMMVSGFELGLGESSWFSRVWLLHLWFLSGLIINIEALSIWEWWIVSYFYNLWWPILSCNNLIIMIVSISREDFGIWKFISVGKNRY